MIRSAQAAFDANRGDNGFETVNYEGRVDAKDQRQIWLELLLARQLTRSTVLSAQISIWDASADLPSAYFPRRSR
jgi:hypothetical protein